MYLCANAKRVRVRVMEMMRWWSGEAVAVERLTMAVVGAAAMAGTLSNRCHGNITFYYLNVPKPLIAHQSIHRLWLGHHSNIA